MNILNNGSKEVELEQHAQANNSAIPESAPTAKSVFESCRKNKTKPHGFSKSVAERKKGKQKLGWAAAVVLRYLSAMLRKQGVEFDDKQWVRVNLEHIAAQYQYLSRTGVDDAIKRLVSFNACVPKNLNVEFGRPKYDRTRWYHVPKMWMNAAEQELRYFYAPLASVIGVPAAVIHYNFSHWSDELTAAKKEAVFPLAPATLVSLQPFSKPTIKRAIRILIDGGLIYPVPGKQCLYAPEPIISSGSRVNETGSKVNKGGSKPDKGGSKPDNNSYYSSFVVSLEECSKNQPPVGPNNLVSCHENHYDTNNGLEHTEFLSPFETLVTSAASSQNKAIRDYHELHQQNVNNSGVVSVLEQDAKHKGLLSKKASLLAHEFFWKIGNKYADELFDNATDEELFEALYPLYRNWFSFKCDSNLQDILYYGVFECVLGAFWYQRHGYNRTHPFACFISVAYECHLTMYRRADLRNQKAVEEENAELQKQYVSVDAEKEWDTELSPSEKTRVFKQALHSRNKIGWICLGGERRTDTIIISKKALKDTEKLFGMNPNASAGDFLRVVDGCMKFYATYPPVGKFTKGNKWHARMAHKLTMFTRHLKTIMKQVGLLGNSPIEHFLNEELEDELEETNNEEVSEEAVEM